MKGKLILEKEKLNIQCNEMKKHIICCSKRINSLSKNSINNYYDRIAITEYCAKIIKTIYLYQNSIDSINLIDKIIQENKIMEIKTKFVVGQKVYILAKRLEKFNPYDVFDGYIKRIQNSKTGIKYLIEMKDDDCLFDEQYCFATREEAQAECDRRNNGNK